MSNDHHGTREKGGRDRRGWTASLLESLCLLGMAMGTLGSAESAAHAANYYLAVDAPTTLGGANYTPNQFVRSLSAIYTVESALPTGTTMAALNILPSGLWQFSPAHPVTLNGTDYEPRDVVSWNGSTYSMVLDGSAVGIPSYARIDALFLDAAGLMVLSFDVPVSLGGIEYSASDLVRYNAGFSLYKDAEASAVPASSNLVGAALDPAGSLVVTFDVPTTIAGATYLPGQLVSWTGTSFAVYFSDGSWPASSQLRDFVFLPASGAVPDGGPVPGVPLTIAKQPNGDLTLNWGASCSPSDTDYEVYEGTMGGGFMSHTSLFCTTGGASTSTFTPGAGSRYYLVVPRNAKSEGSYGTSSAGVERPPGIVACLPRQIASCM